ncbi:MAG: cob(I)yrinic acid a,c-diamide adenosyltransferase [Fimbriimonadaceae bacterium]|nr:cob(I)yrinic acid a,c-diamide adenosyltransferase [Fimbriimonadaceae bacterium]QYK55048.1 MAG: cob(I)yrinic acid a,c-diamide adenosyltransferase [Fimbriimonadaceae bacterium]
MRIYTRTGDKGETGLIGGARVGKDDVVIEALGDLDELNAAIGIVRSLGVSAELDHLLARVQSALFDCGAEVAAEPGSRFARPAPVQGLTASLEGSIDSQENALAPLRNFLLPGGAGPAAHLHLARAVCRRAERHLVALNRHRPVRPELIAFVNRLSDWMFLAARTENARLGTQESVWRGGSE